MREVCGTENTSMQRDLIEELANSLELVRVPKEQALTAVAGGDRTKNGRTWAEGKDLQARDHRCVVTKCGRGDVDAGQVLGNHSNDVSDGEQIASCFAPRHGFFIMVKEFKGAPISKFTKVMLDLERDENKMESARRRLRARSKTSRAKRRSSATRALSPIQAAFSASVGWCTSPTRASPRGEVVRERHMVHGSPRMNTAANPSERKLCDRLLDIFHSLGRRQLGSSCQPSVRECVS